MFLVIHYYLLERLLYFYPKSESYSAKWVKDQLKLFSNDKRTFSGLFQVNKKGPKTT